MSLAEAYDDNVLADGRRRRLSARVLQKSGFYSASRPGRDLHWHGQRVQFGATPAFDAALLTSRKRRVHRLAALRWRRDSRRRLGAATLVAQSDASATRRRTSTGCSRRWPRVDPGRAGRRSRLRGQRRRMRSSYDDRRRTSRQRAEPPISSVAVAGTYQRHGLLDRVRSAGLRSYGVGRALRLRPVAERDAASWLHLPEGQLRATSAMPDRPSRTTSTSASTTTAACRFRGAHASTSASARRS